MRKIHRASATILGSFFVFHIVNHLFAWHSIALHQAVMKSFRTVYRYPIVEVLILFAAVVQIVSGLLMVWRMRKQSDASGKLKIVSGAYLSFFLAYHINAVLMGRFAWKVETDFHFAASVVKHVPQMYFFVPYYFLSVTAVFVHLACVHYQKMTKAGKISVIGNAIKMPAWASAKSQSIAIALTGCIVASFIVGLLIMKE